MNQAVMVQHREPIFTPSFAPPLPWRRQWTYAAAVENGRYYPPPPPPLPMMTGYSRVGLVLFDPVINRIVVLKRTLPYNSGGGGGGSSSNNTAAKDRMEKRDKRDANINDNDTATDGKGGFLEQFFVPRGSVEPHEHWQLAALREFIEESRLLPPWVEILRHQQFRLAWTDPNDDTNWSYTIFFGLGRVPGQELSGNPCQRIRVVRDGDSGGSTTGFITTKTGSGEPVWIEHTAQETPTGTVYRFGLADADSSGGDENLIACQDESIDDSFETWLVRPDHFARLFGNQLVYYFASNYIVFIEWVMTLCNSTVDPRHL